MKNKVVIIACVGIIIVSLVLGAASLVKPATASDLPITTMENVFIDMNGDGKPDFVKYAEAVINGEGNP